MKEIVIATFQYDGDFMNSKGEYYVPEWAGSSLTIGELYFASGNLFIKNVDGDTLVSVGDYVVRNHRGKTIACVPEELRKMQPHLFDGLADDELNVMVTKK